MAAPAPWSATGSGRPHLLRIWTGNWYRFATNAYSIGQSGHRKCPQFQRGGGEHGPPPPPISERRFVRECGSTFGPSHTPSSSEQPPLHFLRVVLTKLLSETKFAGWAPSIHTGFVLSLNDFGLAQPLHLHSGPITSSFLPEADIQLLLGSWDP